MGKLQVSISVTNSYAWLAFSLSCCKSPIASYIVADSFSGSGKSISISYVADDTNASHSIQGYTITYGLGDVR